MAPSRLLVPAALTLFGAAACGGQEPARARGYRIGEAFPAQEKFYLPLLIDWTPHDPGHFYVVEQDGLIHRIPADPKASDSQQICDLRPRVYRGHNEEGLLGIAFDPEYDRNRHLFLYYSEKVGADGRRSVIARMTVQVEDGKHRLDPETELRILRIDQPWGNHNGGTILFGPDRMLYVGLGDGGAADDPHGNGQNLGTLLGSILRIDVRDATAERPYRIPPDNPFVDRKGARGEIWAYGLRNVWRMQFDRETGELWCADVGQNLWEEVDRVVKGGNYGWNLREGFHDFPPGSKRNAPGSIEPVAEYHHREGLSVTGGVLYRGKQLPELVGCYVYGDYVTGKIWAVREDRERGKHAVRHLIDSKLAISAFGEDPDGEIFLVDHAGGRIHRLLRD